MDVNELVGHMRAARDAALARAQILHEAINALVGVQPASAPAEEPAPAPARRGRRGGRSPGVGAADGGSAEDDAAVLASLQGADPLTQAEIAIDTGIKRAAVGVALARLRSAGKIEKHGWRYKAP